SSRPNRAITAANPRKAVPNKTAPSSVRAPVGPLAKAPITPPIKPEMAKVRTPAARVPARAVRVLHPRSSPINRPTPHASATREPGRSNSMLFGEPARADQFALEFPRHPRVSSARGFVRTRIGHSRQNVPDYIQTSLMLVIGLHDNPGPVLMVSTSQHRVPR